MRAELTVCRALALAAGLLAHPLVCGNAAAQDRGSERASTFRVLFPDGSASPSASGEAGEHNRASIGRMARFLGPWSAQKGVRFLFVASRPATCDAGPGCNPDQLHWQRANAATALIKERLGQSQERLRFDMVGLAFLDELRQAGPVVLELPPAPSGAGAIDLRTYVDRSAAGTQQCPWQVLLFDPDLPPVIGARDGAPAIPLQPGDTVPIGNSAVLQVKALYGAGGESIALWEPRGGEFCRAPGSLLAGRETPIPSTQARLHLLPAGAGASELRRFAEGLGNGCRTDLPRPGILRGVDVVSRSTIDRGMDDHVERLPPGALRPAHRERIEAAYCLFAFTPMAPTSSR